MAVRRKEERCSMTGTRDVRVGTSGWSIPSAAAVQFNSVGTHLQRYSLRLRCAEINSSFYRRHTASTYAKWRGSTPADFQFAVKVPRTITHELKLQDTREALVAFLDETEGLAEKRGPLLVQLPPSLSFHQPVVAQFFDLMRELYAGAVVCEPRHATWFSRDVASLLERYRIARVAADPAPVPTAAEPAGWSRVVYFRLHGSPRKYWSSYDGSYLTALAGAMSSIAPVADVWCVFDNTARGAAIRNALDVYERFAVAAGAGERLKRQSSQSSAGHVT
jgi:uncharacterized protein YecE (DUF72 family)